MTGDVKRYLTQINVMAQAWMAWPARRRAPAAIVVRRQEGS
jgi:hypothetical protein